jgi:hypothetical protein
MLLQITSSKPIPLNQNTVIRFDNVKYDLFNEFDKPNQLFKPKTQGIFLVQILYKFSLVNPVAVKSLRQFGLTFSNNVFDEEKQILKFIAAENKITVNLTTIIYGLQGQCILTRIDANQTFQYPLDVGLVLEPISEMKIVKIGDYA